MKIYIVTYTDQRTGKRSIYAADPDRDKAEELAADLTDRLLCEGYTQATEIENADRNFNPVRKSWELKHLTPERSNISGGYIVELFETDDDGII